MRTRIYVDGRPSWSESIPSRARLPGWAGQIVVGYIPSESDRYKAAKQREYKAKKRLASATDGAVQ